MTSDAVANLNFWTRSSMRQQKIRYIASIGRQICDCATGDDKFAETALAIFKVVTQRSEATDIIGQRGIDGLLTDLRARLAKQNGLAAT